MTNLVKTVDRSQSDSIKWTKYGTGVIPLWVADTDFAAPPEVLEALSKRVAHGVFGYGSDTLRLTEVLIERLEQLYGWKVTAEDIVFLPGVVPGFNLACLAFAAENARVAVQTPVYPLLLRAPFETGRQSVELGFTRDAAGNATIDWDTFEREIASDTKLFILCNPQNPLGRVFRRDELTRMAETCLKHGTLICSDEIHCDLVYSGHQHLPIACLDEQVAQRTITLMAPSKTYNLAGLQCSFAIIQNRELRSQFTAAARGLLSHLNTLGCTAALAAYQHGQVWLKEVLDYLQGNRDLLLDFVATHMKNVRVTAPEGTYLAWLDCSGDPRLQRPYPFFLKNARVALNDGRTFGPGGEGHVRLNFGCSRDLLRQALEQMREALQQAE